MGGTVKPTPIDSASAGSAATNLLRVRRKEYHTRRVRSELLASVWQRLFTTRPGLLVRTAIAFRLRAATSYPVEITRGLYFGERQGTAGFGWF